jgi:hypothetical protein
VNRITEQDIEQYIRFPESQSDHKRTAVEKALEASSELQEIAAFFREYDSIFSQLDSSSLKKHVILLTHHASRRAADSSNRLLLAAQTNQDTPVYRTIATLTSEEDETLVKVFDAETDAEYHVQVISNLLDDNEPCILSLPTIGTDLIIGKGGKLTFTPDFDIEEYNWEHSGFALRIPAEKISCRTEDFDGELQRVNDGQYNVKLAVQDQKLSGKVSIKNNSKIDITRVLVTSEKSRHLVRITDDSFRIPISDCEEFNIWLFE